MTDSMPTCEVPGCQRVQYARVRFWDRIQGTLEADPRDFEVSACQEHTEGLEQDEEDGLTVVRWIHYLADAKSDAAAPIGAKP